MISEAIRDLVNRALQTLGYDQVDFALTHPDSFDHGDYAANTALIVAKKAGKNPKEVAEQIKTELEKTLVNHKEISKIEIAGPGFINFYLSESFFKNSIKEIIEKGDEFGKTNLFQGKLWAVEYASPNPNKAMHLGHMRNAITGVALCNLLEANGAQVVREMVDNNRGIAIAKLMWGYLVAAKKDGTRIESVEYWNNHKNEWHTPASVGKSPDMFADDLYVKGAEECKDPLHEQKVRDLVVQWEAENAVVWELWNTVLSFAYEGQRHTLDRLSAKFDFIWHEHEHYKKGKEYVARGLEKGIFKKIEDGAIITDLEAFGLSDTVVEKNDGTSLYITQDLALTDLKKKTHKADRMVWVIGPEQSLAMQQMFAVCEQLGIGKREEFMHIPYGYVSIKGQGKMSSRAGNVVYADQLLNEIKAKVQHIMNERVGSEELETISEMIAHGSVVFELLKMGRMKDTAFDMEAALSFEGDSGPYLQYAVTRANSVLKKAADAGISAQVISSEDNKQTEEETTTELERMLYRFPELVSRAGDEYAPQIVTTYLTELAGVFNSWYGNTVIISDAAGVAYRVALTKAFTHVMQNGLGILAIPVPSKM